MRNQAIIVAVIMTIVLSAGTLSAQYQENYIYGWVPRWEDSDPIGDLDLDGNMEIVVREGADANRFAIYDLVTWTIEYTSAGALSSSIETIRIVESNQGGAPMAIIVCSDTPRIYGVWYDGVSHVSPDTQLDTSEPSLLNSPNPFPRTTNIGFNMPRAGIAEVRIFDVNGREIRELRRSEVEAGRGSIKWDGCDANGRRVAPGTYFYSLSVDGEVFQTSKAVTIR